MAGLQGVGKTTACGKLALYLKGQGKRVSMVATDVYRPAAIDQLVRRSCPFTMVHPCRSTLVCCAFMRMCTWHHGL